MRANHNDYYDNYYITIGSHVDTVTRKYIPQKFYKHEKATIPALITHQNHCFFLFLIFTY